MSNMRVSGARRERALPTQTEPIIHLWMLRLLVPLEGHRKFIRQSGLRSDALARALGLGRWCGCPDSDNDDNEFDLGIGPLDTASDKFDARACLSALRATHKRAEKEIGGAKLPDPLQRNLTRLGELLALSPADIAILAFVVLLENERLLREAALFIGDELRALQAHHALSVILALPEADVRSALHTQGALARTGLLTEGGGGADSLHRRFEFLSSGFSDKMVSRPIDLADLLRGKVNLAAPGHLCLDDYVHVRDSLDILRPYLDYAHQTGRRGVNVFIHGAPGTGKSQLARTLAAELGCELFEIASEDEDGDPICGERRLRAFRTAQSFFNGRRALIVFDEAEDVFSGEDGLSYFPGAFTKSVAQTRKGWVNRALEENPIATLWLSNAIARLDPAFVRRFDMVFELPIPPRKQRQRILQQACGSLLDAAAVARLAEAETLAPAVVTRAASVVKGVASCLGARFNAAARANALEHLIGHTLQAQGHACLQRHDPNRLPDVYDPAMACADVELAQVAEGIRRAGTGRLCLYGPSGTGKTAYGRWLAGQLGAPLLVKRASDLLSKWLGETEKSIASAFREAQRNGAMLLIDEADSFLRDRRGARQSWEVSGVNEMLTQMESFGGVFVASTNLMDGLDAAALRRFDLKVKFDFLRPEQAVELLRRHCEALALPGPDEAARQAVKGLRRLTPGDFAAALRQHRFRPIATAGQLVEILRGDCAIKDLGRAAIGFVH